MHVFIVNSFDNRPGELRQNNIKVHGNIKSSELSTRGATSVKRFFMNALTVI